MSVESVDQLVDRVQSWKVSDRQLHEKFNSIFEIRQDTGHVVIPKPFESKIAGWMKNASVSYTTSQPVTVVRNKVTEEEALFNILRQRRPKCLAETSEKDLMDKLLKDSTEKCDFCNYKQFTAEDISFGRIETEYAYTAANVFKVDAWNSLVMFRDHHPFNWTEEEFLDSTFNAATQWFNCVHLINTSYRYPFIIWDIMPTGGASQVHPHFHIMMTNDKYHCGLELWRQKSYRYTETRQENYFDVIAELHDALGLSVRLGHSLAIPSLTPKKDNEVVLICEQNDRSFYSLLYKVLKVFTEDLNKTGFSLAIALQPLGDSDAAIDRLTPVFGRVVTRGDLSHVQSDIGALDLFGTPSIGTDPFELARLLKDRIEGDRIQQNGVLNHSEGTVVNNSV